MPDVRPIFDWLVAGAPGSPTPAHVVGKLGPELAAAGVRVERIEAFVRTLHPQIAGRTFLWVAGTKCVVRETSYAYLHSPEFAESPMGEACKNRVYVRRRLVGAAVPPALASLAFEGYTDFCAAPMPFLTGQTQVMTFATRAEGGFSDEEFQAIQTILPPLSRIEKIFALQRTAVNLLDTYVGRDAGERILAGSIQRGTTNTLHAAIWFSDLRGFTQLASMMTPGALIGVLNELFECQVPAIEGHGGEVLKFMGDGLLAIFPFDEHGGVATERCDAALQATTAAFRAVERLNQTRSARGDPALRFGVALHVGDVSYGNIGGSGRLDFTAIGSAVNLAARLEGLTLRLGKRVVVSEAFARRTSVPTRELGRFELKGVPAPELVFEPVSGGDLA